MSTMTFAESLATALRSAPVIDLSVALVEECIDSNDERATATEQQFRRAFRGSLADLPRQERHSGLNGTTGHIAESVVESMLVDIGWTPLEHFVGPFSGGHGIDLAMLAPDFETVFAIEVKGTLSTSRWPRLRAGDIPQLSTEWLAKRDNPGVESLGLDPSGFGVLAIVIHFGRRAWRGAVSANMQTVRGVDSLDDLATVGEV